MVGTRCNHHLAEQLVLIGEVTVNCLDRHSCRIRDRVHGRARKSILQEMLTSSEHDRTVLFSDQDCFGCALCCRLHRYCSSFDQGYTTLAESTTVVSASRETY